MARTRVLVVDDEEDIRESIRQLLEANLDDIEVETAASADEAIDVISRVRPDLVITDFKMPGKDGAELLSEAGIRAPGVPRILMTAFPDLDIALRAINRLDVENFVVKPFRPEELVRFVRAALLKRRFDAEWNRAAKRSVPALAPRGASSEPVPSDIE